MAESRRPSALELSGTCRGVTWRTSFPWAASPSSPGLCLPQGLPSLSPDQEHPQLKPRRQHSKVKGTPASPRPPTSNRRACLLSRGLRLFLKVIPGLLVSLNGRVKRSTPQLWAPEVLGSTAHLFQQCVYVCECAHVYACGGCV